MSELKKRLAEIRLEDKPTWKVLADYQHATIREFVREVNRRAEIEKWKPGGCHPLRTAQEETLKELGIEL